MATNKKDQSTIASYAKPRPLHEPHEFRNNLDFL